MFGQINGSDFKSTMTGKTIADALFEIAKSISELAAAERERNAISDKALKLQQEELWAKTT